MENAKSAEREEISSCGIKIYRKNNYKVGDFFWNEPLKVELIGNGKHMICAAAQQLGGFCNEIIAQVSLLHFALPIFKSLAFFPEPRRTSLWILNKPVDFLQSSNAVTVIIRKWGKTHFLCGKFWTDRRR